MWFDPDVERLELFDLLDLPAEAGVSEGLEGDDQRSLFDAEYPGNREVLEEDLPF